MHKLDYIHTLDNKSSKLTAKLINWSNTNSHSHNTEGLACLLSKVKAEFKNLEQNIPHLKLEIEEIQIPDLEEINLQGQPQHSPLGKALRVKKITDTNKINIFFGGHLDTVFPADSSFQKAEQMSYQAYLDKIQTTDTYKLDPQTQIIHGPGTADLKGGLLVMIESIRALELSLWADDIGWEVFLNPDEEIGSPCSAPYFEQLAQDKDFGLIFEPSLPDGSFAYRRKGAGNFAVVAQGKAAHVGREFDQGISATVLLAEFITRAHELNKLEGVILNTGIIAGGTATNSVPDSAVAKVNIRVESSEEEKLVTQELNKIIEEINSQVSQEKSELVNSDYQALSISGKFNRKAKVPDPATEQLFKQLELCSQELGLKYQQKNTGGCCDGNNLLAAGLANIDTLGVKGAEIHSDKEFMIIDSLSERIKLTTFLLLSLID